MATAESVQREPSMEEILASIRRIIEDSDGGRPPPSGAAEPPAARAVETAAAVESAAPEADVFRDELRAGFEAGPAVKKPASLVAPQAQPAAIRPASFERDIPSNAMPSHGADARGEAGRPRWNEPAPAGETAGAAVQEVETAGLEPAGIAPGDPVDDELAHQEIEIDDGDLVLADEPTTQAVPRQALVSEETSRQVAAAFGELSEAFASRSRKSFDEMAEEMLRPMLQDWLDNNLPTLVERLVREEIERVARGAA